MQTHGFPQCWRRNESSHLIVFASPVCCFVKDWQRSAGVASDVTLRASVLSELAGMDRIQIRVLVHLQK